jgi:hypothetical protein
MNSVLRFPDRLGKRPSLHFTRAELNRLLGLYSKRVMTGEWRDYAISFGPGMASFFIFRHSMENPLFVISKLDPRAGKGKRATGRFQVTSRLQKLKQGQSLEDVLAIFDQHPHLVTG